MNKAVIQSIRVVSAVVFCLCVLSSTTHIPSARAEGTARYSVAIEVNWNKQDYPLEVPENPHWSRLIAIAHSLRYSLFADGKTASTGLALLATNGRVSVLEAELNEVRRRQRAGEHVVIGGLPNGVGKFQFQLELTERYSVASFATMLAPSPDWFAGAAGVRLKDGAGHWRNEISVPLWVWDAGADEGPTFSAPNAESQPRESVRLLTHPAFLQPGGLKPIGQATFTRLN